MKEASLWDSSSGEPHDESQQKYWNQEVPLAGQRHEQTRELFDFMYTFLHIINRSFITDTPVPETRSSALTSRCFNALILCNCAFREISKPLVPLGQAGVLLVKILKLLCKGMVRPK